MALGDALTVKHGFAFKGEFFRGLGELIVLTPGNFYDAGGFKPKSGAEKYYDGPVPDGYLLHRGDVVVAMTEQTPGLLGSTATIPEAGVYLHNQRIGLVEVTDPSRLDIRFCYHLFNSPAFREQIQATATGAKVRHTAPERIRSVRVAVPDLVEQQRVAAILDTCDELIANNRRRVVLLNRMVDAVFRHHASRERLQLVVLADAAELDRTSVRPDRSPDEVFDHYSIPAFDDAQRPACNVGASIKSGKFLVTAPSVLVSKLNPRIERSWFVEPRPAVRSVASTEFLVLRPAAGNTLEYLYLVVRSQPFKERLRELSGGTSTSHQRAKPDDFIEARFVKELEDSGFYVRLYREK